MESIGKVLIKLIVCVEEDYPNAVIEERQIRRQILRVLNGGAKMSLL